MTYDHQGNFASYAGASAGVTASLGNPAINTGTAVGDTYESITGLIGSPFDDVLIGSAGDNLLVGGPGGDRLDGDASFDYASYQFAVAGVAASLADPSANTGEAAGDIYIAIEGLVGSSFDDVLTGDDADNWLSGGPGADRLDGGPGSGDYVSYVNSPVGLTASLADPGLNTGEAAGDTYASIERLAGSQFDDVLIGDAKDNTLRGLGGGDRLDGGAGFDFASYFASPVGLTASLANASVNTGEAAGDTYVSIEGLTGSAFDDMLVGNAASNTLIGSGGADKLDGGAGFDYAAYNLSTVGVRVSLANPVSNTGEAAGDSYVSIEGLIGTSFDDVLVGDGADNWLRGNGGADRLEGGAGFDFASYLSSTTGLTASLIDPSSNTGEAKGDVYLSVEGLSGTALDDILVGNTATNTLEGRGGADRLDGGSGFDYAYYANATSGVTASLANPSVNTGEAAGDSYISIEGMFGSSFDDTLAGNSADNTLNGNPGNDILIGDKGRDTFSGGAGDDTFYGGGTAAGTSLDGSTDITTYSGLTGLTQGIVVVWAAGTVTGQPGLIDTDHLFQIEGIIGTSLDDRFDATNYTSALAHAGDFSAYQFIQGGAGNDTIIGNFNTEASYSDATSGVVATMTVFGTGTVIGGGIGTDSLVGVNRIVGSAFSDTFFGTSGAEIFDGQRGGDDVFHGGGGADLVEYDGAADNSPLDIKLAAGTVTDRFGATLIGKDALDSIEQIRGSESDDLYDATGFSADSPNAGSLGTFNQFEGQGGADTVIGNGNTRLAYFSASIGVTVSMTGVGAGTATTVYNGSLATDTFSGVNRIAGSGFGDSFVGSSGDDYFEGRDGNDTLEGLSGADKLDGGSGSDTATYERSTTGVTASLVNPSSNTGDAAGDTYISIENLTGSSFADVLTGDDGANILFGKGGNDDIDGGAGLDVAANNWAKAHTVLTDNHDGSWTMVGPDGTDTLRNIEIVRFADGDVVIGATTVSIAATEAARPEGSSGTTTFTFTVSLAQAVASSRTVSWAVAGSGTSPADAADFTGGVLPSGQRSFAAGQTSQTVAVEVATDSSVEADEVFTMTLSNASSGLLIGAASASATVQNDDRSVVSITALSATQAEGDDEGTIFTFTVSLDQAGVAAQTVSWVVAGSGSDPADATDFGGSMPGGTLTYAPGETSKTVQVTVSGDTAVEPDEGFVVTLSNPSSGVTLNAASATSTIVNDDKSIVSIAAADAAKVEGESGIAPFTFTVSLSHAPVSPQSVDWAVSGSGNHPASISDFEGRTNLPSGTLTFAPGETRKTITVPVVGDTRDDFNYPGYQFDEPDEQFTIELSTPTSGLILGDIRQANGLILTDDTPAVVYTGLPLAREGDTGHTAYPIFIYYFGDRSTTRSIAWTVSGSGDHAATESDFFNQELPSGIVTFAPHETFKAINILLAGDAAVEPDETFTVTLSTVSSGVAVGSVVGTIADDDIVAAVTDVYILLQGRPLTMAGTAGVLENDKDASVASLLATPLHGALQLHGDGAFGYTPDPGFFGVDSFSYRAGNPEGSADAQALLYVAPVLESETATTLNLLALDAEQQVASTYVAFFGRGADAGGFGFWLDEFEAGLPTRGPATLFADIASSHAVSAEAKALHPFLADHPFEASDGQIADFLNGVYDNLFNRLPDADGLAYWTGQVRQTLESGRFVGSVLVDIMSGAQDTAAGQDITTLMGKVAVGLAYVHEQQERHTVWSGASDVAAATELIGAVTADPASVLVGVRNAELLIAEHG